LRAKQRYALHRIRDTSSMNCRRGLRADERWLHSVSSKPLETEVQAAGGRGLRALPCVRAGAKISVCAQAQIYAVRRAPGKTVRAARFSRARQARDRADRKSTRLNSSHVS